MLVRTDARLGFERQPTGSSTTIPKVQRALLSIVCFVAALIDNFSLVAIDLQRSEIVKLDS